MSTATHKDTIFALASGKGRAGVAIVRLSGRHAGAALSALTGNDLPAPRVATTADLKCPKTGALIDKALVLWFPAPKSFTGEDVAELHIHGSHAVLGKLFEVLSGIEGLRLAQAGEFTRRAFEHGKLDLTEAEGLHDLVFAETEAQRTQALYQLEGGLGALYDNWRDTLTECLAHLEATIDFSDEEIPDGLLEGVRKDTVALEAEIKKCLKDDGRGQAIRKGYRIALLGPTNVGKSSLLNALAKEERAIVSDIAGTTRDVIEVHLDIAGYPVVVADTAGLRDVANEIEREGVRRARGQAEEAHLKLVLVDQATWPDIPEESRPFLGPDSLVVITKADLAKGKALSGGGKGAPEAYAISVKTGEGLKALLEAIEAKALETLQSSDPAPITRARHAEALREGLEALHRFNGQDLAQTDPALLAEDLRLAARALGRVTGRVGVEDILGKIFSQFCIGK